MRLDIDAAIDGKACLLQGEAAGLQCLHVAAALRGRSRIGSLELADDAMLPVRPMLFEGSESMRASAS
jgi:hypothetical protein